MTKLFATLSCSLVAISCATSASEPSLSEIDQAVTCPVPTINVARSLAVTDPVVLAKFPLKRVMTAIAQSALATNTPRSMYQAWMGTFANCTNSKVDPNHYGIVCPRVESQLATIDPFALTGAHYIPVALTNRFDLAPTSGANCGEYRIVYALTGGPGRAFLIFESKLPNPTPTLGLAGCAPVADFWAQLSTVATATTLAARLDAFYFTGLLAGTTQFEPVVKASHYGLSVNGGAHALGQIRTNLFANFAQWQLREFKLTKACASDVACPLVIDPVAVRTNPANELFAGTHANAPAFQTSFLSHLASLQAASAATIGLFDSVRFDEFESVSQGSDVIYRNFATAAFKTQIAGAIKPTLTADNILDRAETQTCAGCHQLSNNANLGGGVTWPPSLGFVQIDESSMLSQALITVFLPRRAQVLTSFLTSQCTGTPVANDGLTLAGGALDAAN